MVKIRITGPNTFDWIMSMYKENGIGHECLDNFTESCFAGTSTTADKYVVQLVAEKQWKDDKAAVKKKMIKELLAIIISSPL